MACLVDDFNVDPRKVDDYPLPLFPILRPPDDFESRIPSDYNYTTLPTSNSIRVLRLEPVDLATDPSSFTIFRPPIRCSLVTVDLEDGPLYDALSYTWGDPCTLYTGKDEISSERAWSSRPFDILIDEISVSVGANLYNALLILRYFISLHTLTGGEKLHWNWFWIDALCINQQDLQERTSQVTMMGRIYRQASTVFAWLGGGDRLSDDAITNILHIAKLKQDYTLKMSRSDIFRKGTYEPLGLPIINPTSWIGICMLLNRSWFNRAWIVQEAGFAQDLVFICGGWQISFDVLCWAVLVLHHSGWMQQISIIVKARFQDDDDPWLSSLRSLRSETVSPIRLYTSRKLPILNLTCLWNLFVGRASLGTIIRDDPGLPSSYLPLVSLLGKHRPSETSDPRDKVYAFWGMSDEFLAQTRKEAEESIWFRVDYSLSPDEVFIQTARFLICSSKSLTVLSLKESDPNMSLPSWVPDLSVQCISAMIGQYDCFSASLSLEASNTVFLDYNKIQLSGVKVATIKKSMESVLFMDVPRLTDFLQYIPRSSVITCPKMKESRQIGAKAWSPTGTPAPLHAVEQSRCEVLWRTLCRDIFDDMHPAPSECGEHFLELWEAKVDQLQAMAALGFLEGDISTLLEGFRRRLFDEAMNIGNAREQLGVFYTALQRILGQDVSPGEVIFPPKFRDFERYCSVNAEKIWIPNEAKNFIDEVWSGQRLANHTRDFYPAGQYNDDRYLFITHEGQLGLGQRSLQINDEVWILAGANVPFVLRPVGAGEYRLIGEAYVHGIMHGQAVTEKSKAEVKNIILI